jgi:hypothetical protein
MLSSGAVPVTGIQPKQAHRSRKACRLASQEFARCTAVSKNELLAPFSRILLPGAAAMDAKAIGILILVIVLLATAGTVIKMVVDEDRYTTMSEEEFEAEAKRVSKTGVALLAIQKHVDPSHYVEYQLQEDKHVEADSAESGDSSASGTDKAACD